ncbi:hypothetical protein ASE72_16490 [Sphingomonas sp. Leaf20]|nr:hypothetical protein ASE72_16490 [Sphingomonas sp. Leaf20]
MTNLRLVDRLGLWLIDQNAVDERTADIECITSNHCIFGKRETEVALEHLTPFVGKLCDDGRLGHRPMHANGDVEAAQRNVTGMGGIANTRGRGCQAWICDRLLGMDRAERKNQRS